MEAFDCVFHIGGINFFTDKVRAIKEMIWVARPGTKIVIVDETERSIRENYQRHHRWSEIAMGREPRR